MERFSTTSMNEKKAVAAQIAYLQKTLDFINYKCCYYETAIEAGTEKIHFKEQSDEVPCE